MSIANSFVDFKKEINMVIKQNPLECELYSIIAAMIRERDSSKDISLRDVSCIRQKPNHQNQTDRMYKISENSFGASDFLIIEPNYNYSSGETLKILGSIEVKALYLDLDSAIKEKRRQFEGTIKTFKNLIYTNAIEWRLYKYSSDLVEELVWKVVLGKYHFHLKEKTISDIDEIKWEADGNWKLLLDKLDEIEWNKQ